MAELTPTHSALLELREERQGMQEGYHFLDEKRLVLAAQIMRELSLYKANKTITLFIVYFEMSFYNLIIIITQVKHNNNFIK